jgi:hypothetical protein
MNKIRHDRQIKVLDKIPDIIETLDEHHNKILNNKYGLANKIVYEFIKKNNRILYGGMAIDAALKLKNDGIYDDNEFPDYDFFSPDFIKDSIIIANTLYDAGYKYVRRIPALHPHTIRIQIDFNVYIADINYLDKGHYDAIPTIKYNNVKYIAPEFMKITMYESFSRIVNVYRWDKDLNRLNKIIKYYPSPKGDKHTSKTKIDKKLFEYVYDNCINDSIVAGKLAFCMFDLLTNKGFNITHKDIKEYMFNDTPTIELLINKGNFRGYLDEVYVKLNTYLEDNKLKDDYYIISDTYTGYNVSFIPETFVIKLVKRSEGSFTSADNEKELLNEFPLLVMHNIYGVLTQYKCIKHLDVKLSNHNILLKNLYTYKYCIQIKELNSEYANICDVLKQIYINKENIEYLINCMLTFSKKKLDIFELFQKEFIGESVSRYKIQGRYINNKCITSFNVINYPIYVPDIDKIDPKKVKIKYRNINVKICLVTDKPTEDNEMIGSFYLIENICNEKKEEEDNDNVIMYPNDINVLSYRRIIL